MTNTFMDSPTKMNRNFLFLNFAKTYGIKEFLEADIIGHFNDEFFILHS